MSSDRSTRAAVALALLDTPVNVVVAQDASTAADHLRGGSIDAIVVDARTIASLSAFVDAVETVAPGTPTFVHWGEDADDAGDVLSAVVARADGTGSMDRLAAAITERIESAPTNAAVEPETGIGTGAETDALALDALVGTVRRRLVDVTSPVIVERVLREEVTAIDRFAVAWVGEYDRGEREVVPWLTDPDAMAWPMQRTFGVGDGDNPLLERAMHTRELQALDGVQNRPDAVPFGDHATDRGVDAVAVAPLSSGDDFYGVFVVYAAETLIPREREAIASVADAASHVLESIAIRGRLDQQEQALHRYERLVETAGDGMYVLDEGGHLMTVNDALVEMTGYSREGLLGEHVSILFDREDVDAAEEINRRLLAADESTAALEMSLETKADSTIPCEVHIAVLEREGSFRGSVGVVRDVTERKRSERRLREQNERLDAFARIVSHDLRNPLGVSQGYLDLAAETGSLDHLETVRDGLDRMETIVDDVLAIARDGAWATDVEAVDLETVAAEAWEHVATDGATLSIEGTTTLDADRSRFLRLLENCFRNSVEHGSTGGQGANRRDDSVEHAGADVTVRVGPLDADPAVDETDSAADRTTAGAGATPDRHGFFVADDGRGLPEEVRDRLFDPSVSSSSEGLGIGLWIVREVATGHGWSITATESEAGGARFEFEC